MATSIPLLTIQPRRVSGPHIRATRLTTKENVMRVNSMYYHNAKSNPSIQLRASKPTGFLAFVELDQNPSENQNLYQLRYQFFILIHMFPDFPKKLMKILYLREQGNTKVVVQQLVAKGWSPSKFPDTISTSSHDFLSIDYFWGDLKYSYVKKLRMGAPGSYFTARKEDKTYIICYLSFRRTMVCKETSSPLVQESHRKLFSLSIPLPRPSSIPIETLFSL